MPAEMKKEDWDLLDRKALGAIRLTLSKSVAFNIKGNTTTASLMTALSSMYEQPSAANKVHLIKKLFNLKMSERGNFKEHLNKFNEITDQLNSVDIKFDDEVQALLILGQLPESWKGTVTSISSSCGKSKLIFSEVVDMIMTEEIRRREEGFSSSGSALNMESRYRSKYRGRGRSKSKTRSGRSQSRNPRDTDNYQSQKGRKDIECWNCGKSGHFRNQCRALKKDNDSKTEANVVTEDSDDALICSLESKTESWVLDSGASFHATSNRKLLDNYVSGNLGKVYLGDDQACDVIGSGEVQIQLNGSVWKLGNVRHVSNLRKNLISIGQLAKDGYVTTFAGNAWKVSKGAMTVARGKKNGTLYSTTDGCGFISVAESK